VPREGVRRVVPFGQDLARVCLDCNALRGEGRTPALLPDRGVAGELAV
jgi:hypothetical protein